MTSNDEIASLPRDIYPDMYWSSQEALISDLLSLISKFKDSLQLVVRMHPNLVNKQVLEQDRYAYLEDLQNVTLFHPDDCDINSYALAEISDAVFVYCSTMGIESAYMCKHVYSMSPSYYDFLKVVEPIRSLQELSDTILHIASNDFRSFLGFEPNRRFRCNIFGNMQSSSGILYQFYSSLGRNHGTFLNVKF